MHDQERKLIFPGMLLARAARLWPDKIALLSGEEKKITYAQLYQQACAISHELLQRGVKAGDKVALLFENSPLYHAVYYGIWQLAAIIVPLNTFLTTQEIDHIVQDCQASYVVTSTTWASKLNKEAQLSIPFFDAQSILEEEKLAQISDLPLPQPSLDAHDLIALLYTSGTTGTPKGVMLTSQNIMTNVAQLISCANLIKEDDRVYAALPLFHSFAQNTCVWSAIFVGVTIIIVPKIERKALLQGLAHQPTAMIGVPSLYGLFCLMKNAPLDSIRYFVSGGDALPTKIRTAFEIIYQRKLVNGYGMTEASPFIAVFLDDTQEGVGSVGHLAPNIQARLVDAMGNIIKNSEIGILEIKGNNIMLGYYNAPKATAEIVKDGWLNTGDLATFDQCQRLFIVGRSKDLIINKGFNIYPPEVENVLMSHPAVMRTAVIGISDEEGGEVVLGFITLRQAAPNVVAELRQHCMQQLAAYKVPKKIIVIQDMPINSLMKINKAELKKRFLAGTLS